MGLETTALVRLRATALMGRCGGGDSCPATPVAILGGWVGDWRAHAAAEGDDVVGSGEGGYEWVVIRALAVAVAVAVAIVIGLGLSVRSMCAGLRTNSVVLLSS